MQETVVVSAGPEEWQEVKGIRLRALADAPYAFGSTLAREAEFDDAEWRRRLESGNWFLARWKGRPVGIVAVVDEEGIPGEQHLVAMWVEPEHRGTPTATALVEAVCDRALAGNASAVTLWVADGNRRARHFYERVGFTPTGEHQPLPSNPDLAEERMIRKLQPELSD